ncbi:ABC transporter permease [Flavihumibacter fluvii]|uniref:ABC transporter permease n=1 Tax=Flavihumibacter fluvii TaxID=2838157 RepID=UPI001BDE2CB4|nr:ABC transporter permease [Flavihumibacter fluvii]ULQ52718.1 ABC transporter permease [Flavihumibacter fluvii]
MVKHLFTLIWNKKKQNALLLAEMLISFLVLFAVFSLLVYFFRNYKKPMGLDYDDVWVITYSQTNTNTSSDSLVQFYQTVKQNLLSLPQVKSVSLSSANFPFSNSHMQNGIIHNNKNIGSINTFDTEDSYASILNLKLVEGRWFNAADITYKNRPVVINESLRAEFFGTGKAVGELMGDGKEEDKRKIIGVVKDAKMQGEYTNPGYAMYQRVDTGGIKWIGHMLLKVAPGADAAFEAKLYKNLANSMKSANVEIDRLGNKLKSANNFALVPMIVLSIICTFLIVNVALGLFGVLWYNINKRRGEIGLRRAVGASGQSISVQLVTESILLASLAVIIGSFFAIQFPLLNVFDLPAGIYLTALLLAIIFVYVLVLVCSLYPGRQAAAIYPAAALHEE